MQKILLVIDTFGDLIMLEQMLKKLGFDTLGMQSPLSIQEQLLGFSPEVVVMTAKGTRVHGLELSQKIKKRRGIPKIVLLFPHGYQPQPAELASAQMDAVFETPVDPIRFLTGLCKLMGLDVAVILDKFSRMQGFAPGGEYGGNVTHKTADPDGSFFVNGQKTAQAVGLASANGHEIRTPRNRAVSYKEIAAQIDLPPGGGLPREKIQAVIKDWRKNGVPEQDQELDASRREFVRALFCKGK